MNVRNLFVVNALLTLAFSLAWVLVPEPFTELYGVDLTEAGLYTGRLFGAVLLTLSILTWFAKDAQPSSERKAIMLALLAGYAVGFVISLLGQIAGVVNALGWTTVAIYLILSLAFGYYRFGASEGTAESHPTMQ